MSARKKPEPLALATLVGRLYLDESGARLRPGCALTPEERAFLVAHRDEVLALLRVPQPAAEPEVSEPVIRLTIDEVLARREEADERAWEALMRPPAPTPIFHTRRGFMELRFLNEDEVRDLEARGKVSRAEVITWAATRYRGPIPWAVTTRRG